MTLAELAQRTGIGIATLKRYEAAHHIPASRKNNLGVLIVFFAATGIEFIGSPDDRPGIRIGAPQPPHE